ncbi:hypothetical protein [Nocardia grenadensis]|uniref:hypothetical protein n=1 Tax=Nocardia grenadensis TaxID=931537 RepID=UPI003D703F6B
MTDIQIDPRAFVAAVRKRAADNPEKVYEPPIVWDPELQVYDVSDECVYVEEDRDTGNLVGSCLIGCGLADAGVPVEAMDVDETMSLIGLVDWLGVELPTDVLWWAQSVQSAQDDNNSWSDAVAHADEQNPEVVKLYG